MKPRSQPPFLLVLLAAVFAGIFAARLLENAAPDVVLGEDVDAATADDRSDAVIVDSEIAEPVSEAEVSVELEPDVPTVEEPWRPRRLRKSKRLPTNLRSLPPTSGTPRPSGKASLPIACSAARAHSTWKRSTSRPSPSRPPR